MPKERVTSPRVPEPNLLYSQAFRAGDLLIMAGQVSVDQEGNLVGEGDIVAQTRQVWENIKALCEAAGATMDDVVKTTMYMVNVEDAAKVRHLREEYFNEPYPASTLIGNIALARPELLIEIEAIVSLR